MKRILPILLLIIMAVTAFSIRRCNSNNTNTRPKTSSSQQQNRPSVNYNTPSANETQNNKGFDRNPGRLFFTKHAKCRMRCRHITQGEVKDILINGNINYNKSELQDIRGPKYAVEGNTNDGQHVRIIFAPNTQHISVVTVIDLEEDFACSCD